MMDQIKMIAEPNPDPQFCKITLINRDLLPGKFFVCASPEEAQGSSMLEGFFALGGIDRVMMLENTLTFQKSSEEPWPSLGKKIGAVIRTALAGDGPLLSEDQEKRMAPPQNSGGEINLTSPEAIEIRNLVDREINPSVASHGGKITIMDVKDNVVYVRMDGGCHGCGMAKATLQEGVEKLIRQHFPHIQQIIDVTDHSTGENPYQ